MIIKKSFAIVIEKQKRKNKGYIILCGEKSD